MTRFMLKPAPAFLTALLLAFTSHVIAAVSVTEFGAKGDGIADDTRAIQSALDTGKNVVIPEGCHGLLARQGDHFMQLFE